ncbi:MAG: glycosyltransferase family 4 protein [Chloroflexi bacterium]|nr:glycosyltransferase family 4 protein [Chloroflexota bacterium]
MARLNDLEPRVGAPLAGTRVVVDVRPLQEPERVPITAGYLGNLMEAFTSAPLAGESFVMVLRTLRDDPSRSWQDRGLPIAGRRHLPPTRVLRSAGLTLDSFLLRGAEVGAGAGARDGGAAGTVYHSAGGAVPLGSRLPVVATLLDLAPWELPDVYARSPAARFGHRLRARVLRDAARLIVPSKAMAEAARRRFHVDPERIALVPLAADDEYSPGASAELDLLRRRLALPDRYLVFAGRYDARKDFATLFEALRALRDASADRGAAPRIVLAGAGGPDDISALGRAASRSGVDDLVVLTPRLSPDDLATIIAGSRGFVYPALSEGTGQGVAEALATAVPVIASKVGPLPEIVGGAGIVVEPRDAKRLAAAIRSLWWNDGLYEQLRRVAESRTREPRRTWLDVAQETRAVYAAAVRADDG